LRIIRVKQIAMIYRQSMPEFFLILATAALIIVLPIQQGAALGIILSLLPGTTIWWPSHPHMTGEHVPGVAVLGLQAPLSFLNAPTFRGEVDNVVKTSSPRLIVLEASGMVEIDFTAAQVLLDLLKDCRESGVTVAVARLESVRAQDAFERFKLYDTLPREHVFHSVDEAVQKLGK